MNILTIICTAVATVSIFGIISVFAFMRKDYVTKEQLLQNFLMLKRDIDELETELNKKEYETYDQICIAVDGRLRKLQEEKDSIEVRHLELLQKFNDIQHNLSLKDIADIACNEAKNIPEIEPLEVEDDTPVEIVDKQTRSSESEDTEPND